MAGPSPIDRQCSAVRADGTRCTRWTRKDSDLCQFHSPKPKGSKKEQGIPVLVRMELDLLETIPETLQLLSEEVIAERITPTVANVLVGLARAAIAAHQAIDDVHEKAHKRRIGMSDKQIQEALEKLRAARERRETQEELS